MANELELGAATVVDGMKSGSVLLDRKESGRMAAPVE
jgi:hypothetical protein